MKKDLDKNDESIEAVKILHLVTLQIAKLNNNLFQESRMDGRNSRRHRPLHMLDTYRSSYRLSLSASHRPCSTSLGSCVPIQFAVKGYALLFNIGLSNGD
jgi:hypothetical protein